MNQFWCEATVEIELCLRALVYVKVQENSLILQGQGVSSSGHRVLHFTPGASLLERRPGWCEGPTTTCGPIPEAMLVYILPPALPLLSSVWVHPCALRCECQCRGSSQQTDALCSLLRTSLTWAKHHTRPGQTKSGWMVSLRRRQQKKTFRTFFKHQLTCGYRLYLLSFITLLVFTCSQLMSPSYLVFSRLKPHSETALWRQS